MVDTLNENCRAEALIGGEWNTTCYHDEVAGLILYFQSLI